MPPLNPINAWDERRVDMTRRVARRFCFICEGTNTEKWYFVELFELIARMGLSTRAELIYMERTGEDDGASNPKRLAEFALKVRNNQDRDYGFDESIDKTVLVFDADIFSDKEDEYCHLIDELEKDNIVCVTYPSFELYLILHLDDAYNKWILPNEAKIIKNEKKGKRRYIDKLFSDASGMNPKTNRGIKSLANEHDAAIAQEQFINTDIRKACNLITSNIGKTIQDIKSEVFGLDDNMYLMGLPDDDVESL